MAHVLFAWELGGGWGHLALIHSIARQLHARGHRITLVLRDLTHVGKLFADLPFRVLPAPFSQTTFPGSFHPPATFPHILYNCCCGDLDVFTGLVRAWRYLFELTDPDLVLFDHSPTAIFASRGMKFLRATINNGFFSPPDQSPLPSWRPLASLQQLIEDERKVLGLLNDAAFPLAQAELSRVSRLYGELDANLLCTYPELDHFAQRTQGNYVGVWPTLRGERFHWPELPGPKVFAYLKKFEILPVLLYHLVQLKLSTVVYAPGALPAEFLSKFRSSQSNVSVVDTAVDIEQAAVECDFAITNGTHGTVATFLRAGKPTLNIPLVLEQRVLSERVEALAAGLTVLPDDGDRLAAALGRLGCDTQLRENARAFHERYAHLDGLAVTLEQLDRLLASV